MTVQHPRATVIIPTFDHGVTIRFPIQSLQQQTVGDFEAFIIGDGVPSHVKPAIEGLIAGDDRFNFIDCPKHSRRGEPYRHEVLCRARGRIVCYLTDRDIWQADHLEQMSGLLSAADFAHSLPLHVLPDGQFRAFPVDLGFDGYRQMMQTLPDNRIPFSCFAHTLDAYRQLPEGWTTTPDGVWTDLHMFRKFFAAKALRGLSGLSPTAITFPSPVRKGWSSDQRVAELEKWQAVLATTEGALRFERDVLRATIVRQREEAARLGMLAARLNDQIQADARTRPWRTWV